MVDNLSGVASALSEADELVDPAVIAKSMKAVQGLSSASAALGAAAAVFELVTVIAGQPSEFDIMMDKLEQIEATVKLSKAQLSAEIQQHADDEEWRDFETQFWSVASPIDKAYRSLTTHQRMLEAGRDVSFDTGGSSDMNFGNDAQRLADFCTGSVAAPNVFALIDRTEYGSLARLNQWRARILGRLVQAQQVATYMNLQTRLENAGIGSNEVRDMDKERLFEMITAASQEVAGEIEYYFDQCRQGFQTYAGMFEIGEKNRIYTNARRFLNDAVKNVRLGKPLHDQTSVRCLACGHKAAPVLGKQLEHLYPGTAWTVLIYAVDREGTKVGRRDFFTGPAASVQDEPIELSNDAGTVSINIVARFFYPEALGFVMVEDDPNAREHVLSLYRASRKEALYYIDNRIEEGRFDADSLYFVNYPFRESLWNVGWFWVADIPSMYIFSAYVSEAAKKYVEINSTDFRRDGPVWAFSR